jgi:flagellar biosynthetic protein FliR
MPASTAIPVGTVYSFLLVLARVAGAFVFVPIPGVRNAPNTARVVVALSFTMALYPLWPEVRQAQPGMGWLTGALAAESMLGITIGLAMTFLTEAFLLCAQMAGLQAGYAYASTVDPTTQADSGVLLVFAQLTAGLLFFSLGLHREVLRLFAHTLEVCPPGQMAIDRHGAEALIRLGGSMFSTGIRLAFPVIALLVMVDLALALMGRINAQLQLLTLAMSVKMLASLVVLAFVAALFPRVFRAYGTELLAAARAVLGH